MKHSDDPPKQPDPIGSKRAQPEPEVALFGGEASLMCGIGFMILMICAGAALVIFAIGFLCR